MFKFGHMTTFLGYAQRAKAECDQLSYSFCSSFLDFVVQFCEEPT